MASSLSIKFVLLAAIIGCAYSVGLYEQCAGEGYATFPCNAGLTCFRRNRYYSSCQYECPRSQGWDCETYLPPVPVGSVAAAWDQCGGTGWVGAKICAVGFACYAHSAGFSQCRPINDCPANWECAKPVAVAAYDQCGGTGWTGLKICAVGFACYAYNAGFSQCRPINDCPATWECAIPVAAAAWDQCGGTGWTGAKICAVGFACYAQSAGFSQCRPINDCPANWACAIPVAAAAWDQCGGTGWTGARICAVGFACYAQNAGFSQCRPINDCPAGWACPNIVASTAAPVVVGPTILASYEKCNNVGNATCIAGTACYKSTDVYWECRPSCPPTWACETEVVGLAEQCGGEGYTGFTRCAAGLNCYVRNQYYAHCAASCPGAGWIC